MLIVLKFFHGTFEWEFHILTFPVLQVTEIINLAKADIEKHKNAVSAAKKHIVAGLNYMCA